MPPKKHNGFMMFVHSWRERNTEGRRMSVSQAVTHCGEIWKNMSAQERGPYLSKAKDAEVQVRSKRERLNCHGKPLSVVEREEREAAERVMSMKRSIEKIVLNGKAQHDLENTQFMFASFNYFTKAISSDVYIPAEFAACQYSLKSGMTSIYSSHINPGQLIFGQGSDALHHTSTTHQLPLPPTALGESDMGRLYANIVEYIRGCQVNPEEPLIVFTTNELMPVVKGCFRYLQCDCDEEVQSFDVFDIQYLFYVLKKEVMDIADLAHDHINKCITDTKFLNDYFEYSAGISCQFHEVNDRGRYCTQSMVTRWAYDFSDYMCGDLAIKPLPGKHMPPKQEAMFRINNNPDPPSNNSSFASFHTTRSTTVKQEVQSDYVLTDHTAFAGNLAAASDFPSLGDRKSKSKRQPFSNASNARDPRNDWDVRPLIQNAHDYEDAFDMHN